MKAAGFMISIISILCICVLLAHLFYRLRLTVQKNRILSADCKPNQRLAAMLRLYADPCPLVERFSIPDPAMGESEAMPCLGAAVLPDAVILLTWNLPRMELYARQKRLQALLFREGFWDVPVILLIFEEGILITWEKEQLLPMYPDLSAMRYLERYAKRHLLTRAERRKITAFLCALASDPSIR